MRIAPTPRETIQRDGCSRLYRFPRSDGTASAGGIPTLVVPSLINRWYIVDLREGASMIAALKDQVDTFCLDWGVPEDEDRYMDWEAVLGRLGRAVRKVCRVTGSSQVSLLGYCMGGTLAAIYSALEPDRVARLVNLAGPIDFSQGGTLTLLTDEAWFDPESIAAAGNIAPFMMQSGFLALRPTLHLAKLAALPDTLADPEAREAFESLEAWSSDNIPFPAAAYVTYVRELYQQNLLLKGEHRVGGKRVDLGRIGCPVMTIVTSRDTICPPPAATALHGAVSSTRKDLVELKGGHVGAVVGRSAREVLYPALGAFLSAEVERKN